jgi:hypothetical protein
MVKRITDLPAASTLVGDELLEVSQLSTSVTITENSISAAASDNSFNDSGTGFVSAGFAVGDRIKVTGFANGANNLLVGIVTDLTAGKMTIGGTDGDVIVDESSGASVTVSKWGSRRATLADIGIGGGYDILFGFAATPTSDQVLATIPIVRDMTFEADLMGSVGTAADNPSDGDFVISIKDDGVVIATVTISTGGSLTFATASGTAKTITAGSFLTIEAPSPADSTVANTVVVLKGEQA